MSSRLMTLEQWRRYERGMQIGGMLLLSLFLAIVAGGAVYLWFQPMYRGEAWLRIESRAPYIAFRERGDSRAFVQTQVQMIKSPLVLGPVVSQPEIASCPEVEEQQSPIDWLAEEINVEQVGTSDLFTVSFAGPSPENSAKIVNAVVQEYFDLRAQEDAERMQRVISLLEDERERRAAQLDRLREEVRQLSKQATGTDPFAPKAQQALTTAEHPFEELKRELTKTQAEREMLKARINAREEVFEHQRDEVSDALVDEALGERPEVRELEESLASKRIKLREYEVKLADGADNKQCQSLAEEIESAEQRLEHTREVLRPEVESELRTARETQHRAELARMMDRLRGYELMEKYYSEKFREELEKAQQFTGETLELRFAQADLAREEEVFALIARRVMQLRTEQRAPARVALLMQAEPPKEPVKPPPHTKISLVSLGGFLLPWIVLGVCVPMRRWRPREREDPVFGRIRLLKRGTWRGGDVRFDTADPIGVAIRADKRGPADAHRRAFVELRSRYDELKPSIEETLFAVYEADRARGVRAYDPPHALAELTGSQEIWGCVRLLAIRIEIPPGSATPQFVLGYALAWDPDRVVRVFVWDWSVVRSTEVELVD